MGRDETFFETDLAHGPRKYRGDCVDEFGLANIELTFCRFGKMDVVPVPDATLPRWTHPPFEGKMDDEGWIWGRGSADCKNSLMAILAVVEKLVEEGFKPER